MTKEIQHRKDDEYAAASEGASEAQNIAGGHQPTVGEMDLEARSSLRRLTRGTSQYTDEQSDGYDV